MSANVLERVSILAPFGVMFTDSATGLTVSDGLRVVAYPKDQPLMRKNLLPNHVGTFVLNKGPRLQTFLEEPSPQDKDKDTDFVAEIKALAQFDYVVEVTDDAGQFMSFRFPVKLPHLGLYTLPCVPPPVGSNRLVVPLFPTSARELPAGTMAIYATLWNKNTDKPAAGAVIEAQPEGLARKVQGISDDMGRVTLIFPVPPLRMGAGVDKKDRFNWPTTLTAAYKPPADDLPQTKKDKAGFGAIPDLCVLLGQPKTASLFSTAAGAALNQVTINQRETVLRTDADPFSRLLITASP